MSHPAQPVDHMIGRHHGIRVQLSGIDQSQADLPRGLARTRAIKRRADIALQMRRGERAGVAQQAGAEPAVLDDLPAMCWIAWLRLSAACRSHRMRRQASRHSRAMPAHQPNASAVIVLNQASAYAASCARCPGGASSGLTPPAPAMSVSWPFTGRYTPATEIALPGATRL